MAFKKIASNLMKLKVIVFRIENLCLGMGGIMGGKDLREIIGTTPKVDIQIGIGFLSLFLGN